MDDSKRERLKRLVLQAAEDLSASPPVTSEPALDSFRSTMRTHFETMSDILYERVTLDGLLDENRRIVEEARASLTQEQFSSWKRGFQPRSERRVARFLQWQADRAERLGSGIGASDEG